MHPAKSVIYFTTTTGAGYGLIVMLAIMAHFNLVEPNQTFGFVAFAIAMLLIGTGLLSSTLHLGHPERAWRALSQWKSSWLSREGVAAIVTFLPIAIFGVAWVFLGKYDSWALIAGIAAAVMSLGTVYCTSMIYASLKSIPAWHNGWTSWGYLGLSIATGALLMAALCAIWSFEAGLVVSIKIALVGLVAGLLIKLLYWRSIHAGNAVSTAESATGLGRFGKVTMIEGPHTEANYLLEEMGFKIARKHAGKLRLISIVTGFVFPAILLLAAWRLSFTGGMLIFALCLTVAICAVGIVVERWLFFAEAKHVVTLYYGEAEA